MYISKHTISLLVCIATVTAAEDSIITRFLRGSRFLPSNSASLGGSSGCTTRGGATCTATTTTSAVVANGEPDLRGETTVTNMADAEGTASMNVSANSSWDDPTVPPKVTLAPLPTVAPRDTEEPATTALPAEEPEPTDPPTDPDDTEEEVTDPETDNDTETPVTSDPNTDATVPDAEVTDPNPEVTDPDAEVTDPETEVTDPDAEVTDPDAEVTDPETEETDATPAAQIKATPIRTAAMNPYFSTSGSKTTANKAAATPVYNTQALKAPVTATTQAQATPVSTSIFASRLNNNNGAPTSTTSTSGKSVPTVKLNFANNSRSRFSWNK